MKVLFVADFFNPTMGYISNFLPLEICKLNNEVAILLDLKFLKPYLDGDQDSVSIEVKSNCTIVKVTESFKLIGVRTVETPIGPYFKNLLSILQIEQPDVVQSFVITTSLVNTQLILLKKEWGYIFCLQDHSSKSVFTPNLKGRIYLQLFRLFLAPFFNRFVDACFIPSPDIFDVVHEQYGLNKQITVFEPLGVNDDWFHLPSNSEKEQALAFIRKLGVPQEKFIVVYAGRLTTAKGADFLAAAIGECHKLDDQIVGVFVGRGSTEEIQNILQHPGCHVYPMQLARNLPLLYWSSNIGVWAREGSTSILDALASGLPAVVRSGLTELERRPYDDWVFEEESKVDLVRVIMSQFKNQNLLKLTVQASNQILKDFTWKRMSKQRLTRYSQFLNWRQNEKQFLH